MKKSILASIAVLALASVVTEAKVSLPSVLSSDMVLQQQTDVKLWGKARPDAKVKITPSWDKNSITARTGADGLWEATLTTPEASNTPRSITFDDGEKTVLDNVLIGEVWFCCGQSNMEMPMRGFDRQPLQGTNTVIAKASPSTPVRAFLTDCRSDGSFFRQSSKTPVDTVVGIWATNTPDNVAKTSAVAYFFARYVQEVLDVPVGIIVSSLGGSRIEPWMSRESLSAFPSVDLSKLDNDEPVKSPWNTPTSLYNAKIHPFLNVPVRGMLWYQGESNLDNADIYDKLMGTFVSDLRTRWNNPDMPFYFVEIAPFNYEGADGFSGALLREAQQKAAKAIPNSGIASTIDIGSPIFIHPVDKATVGDRLAWLALAKTYGKTGFGSESPVYKSMKTDGNKIKVYFDKGGNGLCPLWTNLKGFEIAGEDRVFYPADAMVDERDASIAVSSDKVAKPVAVRYAFRNVPQFSAYNIHGLPLLPFRTDNWELK